MKIVAVATAVVAAVAVGKAMVNKSSGKENPPEVPLIPLRYI